MSYFLSKNRHHQAETALFCHLSRRLIALAKSGKRKLIEVLHQLADEGHAVVVIEHHMAIAAEADWILDLGPGAGNAGGKLVAVGTPETVAKAKKSQTAPFLLAELDGSAD